MASIRIDGLTKCYEPGAAPALDGLDLELRDGELLVLVGPSGCGKSTVLRLVAGLEQPDAGRILLDERDLGHVAPQARDVAMVFQGYALYPHLSVRDNIAFPLRMRGVPKAERARKVTEAASLLGLARLLDRRPGELSGGEQQRVAMARAIVRSPKVFLFDEPLSNLDAKLRSELRVELARLVRRLRATAMYVTHDQAEAMTMADRVAVLRAGTLQQVGAPRQVYERPANTFVAEFLGTPSMNLVTLECGDGRGRAPGVALPLPKWLAGRASVTVGVRPEQLQLGTDGDEDEPTDALRARAKVVATEPLGAETYVHLDAEGTPLRARVAGFEAPTIGSHVTATAARRSIHWFDAEEGSRIRAPGDPPGDGFAEAAADGDARHRSQQRDGSGASGE